MGFFVKTLILLVIVQTSCTAGPQKPTDAKILIIGVGMTGAMAAKTLHEAGETDFLILETAGRVGGRMWNVPFGGQTVELGALWFHGGLGNPVWDRARDLGMECDRISGINGMAVRDEEGNDLTEESNEIYARLNPIRSAAYNHGKVMLCNETEKPDTSRRRILSQYGWNPKTPLEQVIDVFSNELGIGQYPDGCSTRYYYGWGYDDFEDVDYILQDPRGYSYVVQSFLDDVLDEDDPRLQLGITVTTVSQNDSHVTVETSSGETYTSEYLLSTVSLGVLQHEQISWTPPFSQEKFEAIMQNKIGTYMQVYLKFDEDEEPFWDDDVDWILFASNRPRYWSTWQNMNLILPGSRILQATLSGEEAERVERLSNEQVQEEAMDALRKMYGPDIPDPISILVPRWNSLNNFFGSYSDWPVGYDVNMNRNLRAPHGRVHFAGEAMSSRYFGYVHGAYYEGIRGAEFMMECMQDEECEMPIVNECEV